MTLAAIKHGPGGYRVTFPHIRDRYRETRAVIAALKAIDGRRYDPVAQAWYVPAASSAELEVWAVEVGAPIVEVGTDPDQVARLSAQVASLTDDVARLTDALRREKARAGAHAVARRATPRTARPVARSARADGCTLGKATGKGHSADCAEHWRVPGLRRSVCVLRPGSVAPDGSSIGPDWTDRETVLTFAVDCGARTPAALQ